MGVMGVFSIIVVYTRACFIKRTLNHLIRWRNRLIC